VIIRFVVSVTTSRCAFCSASTKGKLQLKPSPGREAMFQARWEACSLQASLAKRFQTAPVPLGGTNEGSIRYGGAGRPGGSLFGLSRGVARNRLGHVAGFARKVVVSTQTSMQC
jgi:hypothetical protein